LPYNELPADRPRDGGSLVLDTGDYVPTPTADCLKRLRGVTSAAGGKLGRVEPVSHTTPFVHGALKRQRAQTAPR
jgi:hypothetical protein